MTRASTLFAAAMLVALFALLAPFAAAAQSSPSDYTFATRYDGAGRVTGTIAPDPDGAGPLHYAAVRTSYDDAGRAVLVEKGELAAWKPEAVAPAGWGTDFAITSKVETVYDALDRKVLESAWGWDASLVTPAWVKTSVTQYSYDAAGLPECTAVRMDPATWATLPASACALATAANAPNPDRITRTLYDAAGQVLRVQKAVGTPLAQDYVTYTYSANGKPLTVKDANGNVAGYSYDGFDRLVAWAFPSKTATGAVAACTLGTITETTDAFGAAVAGPSAAPTPGDDCEKYAYDRGGNRAKLMKRDGRTFAYAYDNLNRLTVKTVPGTCVNGFACTPPPASAVRDVYYGYDLRGLQLYARYDSATGPDGVAAGYDGFGRQASDTVTMGSVSRTVFYKYDANGNRRLIVYPDNLPFAYIRDGLDRITAVSSLGVAVATMTYDADGQQAGETRGSVATTFGYDPAGRLKSLADDLAGTSGDLTSTFTYNPASQLIARTRSNTSYAWTGYTNVSRGYEVNGLNQYTSAGSATFGYDANGNLANDGTTAFTYDAENRLVADNTGTVLTYDPLGRLYAVTKGAATETYLYAGDQRIAEYDASGTVTARYVPGSGEDNPLIWYNGSGTADPRALQGDERGSIVSVADASGALIAINSYDEYGIPPIDPATKLNLNTGRYQYTGQLWIPQLGLYYYKARFYSPFLGRFLQTDPIGYADQNNLYAYVGNDPTDRTDSKGLKIDVDGDADYKKSVNAAIKELKSRPYGKKQYNDLKKSKNVFTIMKPRNPGDGNSTRPYNTIDAQNGKGSGAVIYYDPTKTDGGRDIDGKTERPAFVSLGHEFGHGDDINRGVASFDDKYRGSGTTPPSEQGALDAERAIRAEHGLKDRPSYD